MTNSEDATPAALLYVHGAGSQPSALAVKDAWDAALFSPHLGDRSDAVHYADIIHPKPGSGEIADWLSARIDWENRDYQALNALIERDAREFTGPDSLPSGAVEFAASTIENMVRRYHDRMHRRGLENDAMSQAARTSICRYAVDVTRFLFFKPIQEAIRERLLQEITDRGEFRFIVISHGLGSVVAYWALHQFEDSGIEIPLWLTIGSPLGDSVFRKLLGESLRLTANVGRAVNVVFWEDPVVSNQSLERNFEPNKYELIPETIRLNSPSPDPHNAVEYLSQPETQELLREFLPSNFLDPIGTFSLAVDVAEALHRNPSETIPILIELDDTLEGDSLDQKAERLEKSIREVVRGESSDPRLDRLKRYVAAELLPVEIKKAAKSKPSAGCQIKRCRQREGHLQWSSLPANLEKLPTQVSTRHLQPDGPGHSGPPGLRVPRRRNCLGNPRHRNQSASSPLPDVEQCGCQL